MLKLMRAYPIQALIGLVSLLLFFGVNIATLYTDWLWFGEVGYRSVFNKTLGTRLLLFSVFGAASFALAYGNLRLAERFSPPLGVRLPSPDGEDVFLFDREGRPRRVPANDRVVGALSGLRRLLVLGLGLGALAFAVFAGLSAQAEWDSFLRLRNPTVWNATDPVFGRDIGFYVFTLPFVRFVQKWLLVVLLLIAAAVAVLYFFQRGIDTAAGRTVVAPHVRAHLSALLALALLTQACGYWLDRFDLLTAGGKIFSGAGYTDIHARLPALNGLVGVTVLAALAVLFNIRRRSLVLPGGALVLWGAASLLGSFIPGTIQATVVRPNEATREAPFIQRAIESTRAAYGLSDVSIRDFPAEPNLGVADLKRNQTTLNNIRLWDYEPLLQTIPQQQGLRQYYSFPDVDVDRYRFGGSVGHRQVWLAAREINPEGLDARAQTWPNLHLRYTHGFGVVMSPVNEFTPEGLPTYFLKDIPAQSSVPGLTLTQPRIYYGQGSAQGTYVIVGTRQVEFDYPSDPQTGTADYENRYDGRGGVRLGPLAKWAFAWRFRDPTLLLSRDVTADSRMLFARRVPHRVARVAPFLRLDGDPYPVISQGRVLWIQDAYTTTNAYPYSAAINVRDANNLPMRFNYIRNAVKAVVDAYDGTVTLYAADERDPILRTYQRIFPGLVQPQARMPADLRAHVRYPEDLFAVQRQILADYHVTNPGVFYARADSWQIARERRNVDGVASAVAPASDSGVMLPYYVVMRLPEERVDEFLLLSPFTPRNKPNMIALLAARCEPERYGELVLYRFPSRRTVYGPEQIGARIRQDSQISQLLSLWDQRGSRVLFGNMLVVPIEKSLLYVQPLYLKAQNENADPTEQASSIPELKRVIVAFENRIAMEPTLGQALARVFGEGAASAGGPTTNQEASPRGAQPGTGVVGMNALIERANAHYGRAQAALRNGDFATYGREMKTLGDTLKQLQARPGSTTSPAAGTSP